ncbi:MAG TPA: cytochrome P450 [Solirubrobacteraceae bacterium]|nr:cytochrome P450 [Solirubrobacteraceae bacterium]
MPVDLSLPPGPRQPRGAQVLQWIARPVPFAKRCRERFGDMFTVDIDLEPFVFLAHPDAVRQVFTGGPELMHAGEANDLLRPIVGSHSILLLDEREHMRQRKLMLPPFHGERMQRYRELMVAATERAMERWPAREAFALRPSTQAITLDVIMQAVFGVDAHGEYAELRSRLERMLAWAGQMRGILVSVVLGPENRVVVGQRRRMLEPVDRALYGLIARRREAEDLAERDDILSMLLLARDESGEGLSDAELRDELMTLLLAGHETTATSLAWAFERLVRDPAMLDRLAGEARAGEGAYAEAVVKETLRLRPVLPVVARKMTRAAEIGGRMLPAGTMVMPCIILVHRREDVYPEPERFRPERFLETPAGTYTWIPFGGGVRRCLGAAFAQMEMQVVLQTIVAQVRLEAAGGEERISRRGITLVPKRGGEVRLAA